MLPITLLLASHVLGSHINLFLEKAATYNVDPLVAAAVIKCESGGNPKAIHINKNGSIDRGLGQVNSTWDALAAARGDDLMTVEGNLDFTFYLMSQHGFTDYRASAECWGAELNKAGQDTS